MGKRIWLITGASEGFGYECVKAALAGGDLVAAAARRTHLLDALKNEYGAALLPLTLDVTRRRDVFSGVAEVRKTFGGLDILVNNAGFGVYSTVEELRETDLRQSMETNFFGSVNVIQAVLPEMRRRKAGRIIQISSFGGIVFFPLLSAYNAPKAAIEGFVETLAQETAAFGIKVTLVEPGPFATAFHKTALYNEGTLGEYAPFWRDHREAMQNVAFAPPEQLAHVVLRLADDDDAPLRVLAGAGLLEVLRSVCDDRLKTWEIYGDAADGTAAADGNNRMNA